jgi:hypothetical protein
MTVIGLILQLVHTEEVDSSQLFRPESFTSTEVVYGVTGTEVTELPEYGVSP